MGSRRAFDQKIRQRLRQFNADVEAGKDGPLHTFERSSMTLEEAMESSRRDIEEGRLIDHKDIEKEL